MTKQEVDDIWNQLKLPGLEWKGKPTDQYGAQSVAINWPNFDELFESIWWAGDNQLITFSCPNYKERDNIHQQLVQAGFKVFDLTAPDKDITGVHRRLRLESCIQSLLRQFKPTKAALRKVHEWVAQRDMRIMDPHQLEALFSQMPDPIRESFLISTKATAQAIADAEETILQKINAQRGTDVTRLLAHYIKHIKIGSRCLAAMM